MNELKQYFKHILKYYPLSDKKNLEENVNNLFTELDQALQLQQTGVKQSVFYSIVDNGSLLEKFKEKETAEYALEEYKRMGFPYATILETVA